MSNSVNKGKSTVNAIFTFCNRLKVQSDFFLTSRFRHLALIIILLITVILYISGPSLKKIQYRQFTTGFSYNFARHFLYFYYYTGYFPLATTDSFSREQYSRAKAREYIEKHGERLIMEYCHWSRMGENARIFAFIPDALIEGPQNPKLKLFNSLIFLTALMVFFVRFQKAGYGLFAFLVALIILFTPFFQYAVFREKNIFALMASVFLLLAGFNANFIFNKKINFSEVWVVVLSGILSAFFTEIRGEIIVVLFSVVMIYLITKSLKIPYKLLMIITLLISFLTTRYYIRDYFNRKFDQTFALVSIMGGHPYTGKKASAHSFWHPIFCGLGDFDNKYGYQWNDTIAYHYALPLLKKKTGLDFKYSGKYHLDAYYDPDSLYYMKFEELPEYEKIIKTKVISNIRQDPLWYAEILFKRLIRILSNTLPFRYCGWLIFLAVFVLLKRKSMALLWFLFCSFPLSLTPFLIYSGGNSTYNSLFPIIALAILITFLLEKIKFIISRYSTHG